MSVITYILLTIVCIYSAVVVILIGILISMFADDPIFFHHLEKGWIKYILFWPLPLLDDIRERHKLKNEYGRRRKDDNNDE